MTEPANPRAGLSPVKRALLALEEMQARLDQAEFTRREPIAVIGLALRVPGAADANEFWRLLQEGKCAIGKIADNRPGYDAFEAANRSLAPGVDLRRGGFLDHIETFDAAFFGVSPREAARLDPAQRILLETTWRALESAGLTDPSARGTRVAIYVGAHGQMGDYWRGQAAAIPSLDPYSGLGTAPSALAGRLAYWLDAKGPAATIDTACSSSLVAVHQAMRTLRAGEADLALVAGVNVILDPAFSVACAKMGLLAVDGRCKSFQRGADGYGRGEGVAVLVLRRQSDALANGEPIRSLLLGSAVNQDGATSSLSAPSGAAQVAVIRAALADGAVSPEEISFIEAHGTGTPLGDPIEMEALAEALGPAGSAVGVSSVKTNIGHLEGAAGAAGLIKTVLCLERQTQAPIADTSDIRADLETAGGRLTVLASSRHWRRSGSPRRAGVSAFGWTGTNAHVVVGEAPTRKVAVSESAGPLLLSARGAEALAELASNWATFLEACDSADISDAIRAQRRGRKVFPHRLALRVDDVGLASRRLREFARGAPKPDGVFDGVAPATPISLVFDLTGRLVQMAPPAEEFGQRFREADEEARKAFEDDAEPVLDINTICRAYAVGEWWKSLGLVPEKVIADSSTWWAARSLVGEISLREAAKAIRADAAPDRSASRRVLLIEAGNQEETARASFELRESGIGLWLGIDEATSAIPPECHRLTAPRAPSGWDEWLARLFVWGAPVRWAAIDAGPSRPIDVPGHPFLREPFWFDASSAPSAPFDREQPEVGHSTASPRMAVATDTPSGGLARRARLLDAIRNVVARSLGVEPSRVPLDRTLREMGLDSMAAAEAAIALGKDLGRAIDAIGFFRRPTILAMADWFESNDPPSSVSTSEAPVEQTKLGSEPKLASSVAALVDPSSTDIAIIAVAFRFPGADSPEAFWRLIESGDVAVGPAPRARRELGLEDLGAGGYVEGVDLFDAAFFGISPREARWMDPQQRLTLEVAWELLERGGYAGPKRRQERTGVYVGLSTVDYLSILEKAGARGDAHAGTGSLPAMVANRVSHLFDLRGPSVTIDAACSSSLVATRQACADLRSGECSMAIAAGVNLTLMAAPTRAYREAGMLSPSGQCHSFDDRADGYVRGEGVGAILLKRLSAAIRDGDPVIAVIKAAAVNHDGRAKATLTAPRLDAQVELLAEVYASAGVPMDTVGLWEAHGSATPLGDPIEFAAAQEAMERSGARPAKGSIALGSVKSNVGHLEAAAGMAGLIKAALALSARTLPASPGFASPNRRLMFEQSPFFLCDRSRDWESVGPRRAGVTSLGAGGVNAHVILEEPPRTPALSRGDDGPRVFCLSARTASALRTSAARLETWLGEQPELSLGELAFTLAMGRDAMPFRLAVVARTADELADRLALFRLEPDEKRRRASRIYSSFDGPLQREEWRGHVDRWDQASRRAVAESIADPSGDLVMAQWLDASRGGDAPARIERNSLDQLTALAEAHAIGWDVDWRPWFENQVEKIVTAPTYPFERIRCWIKEPLSANELPSAGLDHAVTPARREDSATRGSERDLTEIIARMLEVSPEAIEPNRPLTELGVDSILAVRIAEEIAKLVGRSVPPTIVYEAATLRGLAERLIAPAPMAACERIFAERDSHDATPRLSRTSVAMGERESDDGAIAVVGIAGRFPGAATIEEFARNLFGGRDVISEAPASRFSIERDYDPTRGRPGTTYSKWGGWLERIEWFDAEFFGVSPREAALMDPAQRLLLETAWEALESAAMLGESRPRSTGVFVGATASQYLPRLLEAPSRLAGHAGPGTAPSILANRVSHALDLAGPSMTVDTACSSSLVAIHLAIQSLRRGECDAALAGGAQVGMGLPHYVMLSGMGALSPTGRRRPFDEGADGYTPGEGVGWVVLRRLKEALGAGDPVLAVIRGSAALHGGRSAGLTAPRGDAEEAVIRQALADANVDPATIGMIEAHGTGTALGDPIEVAALVRVFAGQEAGSIALGSVKSNIGHAEPAAGVTGVIKTIIALNAGMIPPTLFSAPTSAIDWATCPLFLPSRPTPWPADKAPWRAGVSSFGFGGANAHVVIEASPFATKASWAAGLRVMGPLPVDVAPSFATGNAEPERLDCELATGSLPLLLSAKTVSSLREMANRLRHYLTRNPGASLTSICRTLVTGRARLGWRWGAVVSSREEAIGKLGSLASGAADGSIVNVSQTMRDAPPSGDARAGRTLDRSGELSQVVESFLQGVPFEAKAVFGEGASRRIDLPTYPFERRRYWLEDIDAAASDDIPASDTAASDLDDCWWEERWEDVESARGSPNAVWIAVAEKGAASGVDRGAQVGEAGSFQLVEPPGFLVESEEAWREAALAAIKVAIDAAPVPVSVVHALSIGPARKSRDELARGFWLVREMIRRAMVERWPIRRIVVVTQSAANVRGKDHVVADRAALIGLVRSAAKETSDIIVSLVDVDPSASTEVSLETLKSTPTPETVLAIRNDRLFAPRTRRAVVDRKGQGGAWRTKGAWIVTGGFGGVGREIARELVARGRPVVLVSRSAPILGEGDDSPPGEDKRNQLLIELRQAGGEVVAVRADVTDRVAMGKAIAAARERFGQIAGVVHAAGIGGDRLLRSQSIEEAEWVLAPKVEGGRILLELCREERIEWLIHCSSLAAAWGNVGQSAYAAANAYLDGQAGIESWPRVMSLAFGPWEGTGLANDPLAARRWASLGLVAITPSEGRRLFAMSLAAPRTRWLLFRRPSNSAPEEFPDSDGETLRVVIQELAAVLRLSAADVDPGQPFAELGLDSILADEFVARLGRRLGMAPIRVSQVFEHPTPAKLASALRQRCRVNAVTTPAPSYLAAPSIDREENRDVAIIGYGARLPGSRGFAELWRRRLAGESFVAPLSPRRWRLMTSLEPKLAEQVTREEFIGAFLDEIDEFDPARFRISPAEASQMDPRQRLVLETAWRALVHAGEVVINGHGHRLAGTRTGVFVGSGSLDYFTDLETRTMTEHAATGGAAGLLGSRIAYLLDLRGPVLTVDTACSSSLVALHLAIQSLRRDECDTALVIGAHAHIRSTALRALARMGALAPDRICRPFDTKASGFTPGEAIVALVLKRASDAARMSKPVAAIIRGSAVNNDGASNGLTAPNVAAQRDVLQAAWTDARVSARELGYLVAHGTGTPLGDPVELDALATAMTKSGAGRSTCFLGSAKGALGHADAAAGLVGVIEAIAAMATGWIPPTVGLDEPNRRIDFATAPFTLVDRARRWLRGTTPRIAGVSAFGFGGTNAHIVVEEPRGEPLPLPNEDDAPLERGSFWVVPFEVEPPSWLRSVGWRECRLDASQPRPTRWLWFTNGASSELAVIESLRKRGESVEVIDGSWQSPDGEAERLRVSLGNEARRSRIVIGESRLGRDSATAILEVCRALARGDSREEVDIRAIVRGVDWVHATSEIKDFAGGAALGLLAAAAKERPWLSTQAIDLGDESETDVLLEAIASEPMSGSIARRQGAWYRREVRPYSKPVFARPILRATDHVLVTGGLGGLGREVAKWLAREYRARLTLVSRSARADDSLKREIESIGSRVSIARADVTDRASLQQAIDAARTMFGPIDVVFHLAGQTRTRGLSAETRDGLTSLMDVAVGGAATLDELLGDGPRAMVLFSSIAGWEGNVFQPAYSAASRALETFAGWRTARGRRTISLAWGLWAETGMGLELARRYAGRAEAGMSNLGALACLAEALLSGESRLGISAHFAEAVTNRGETRARLDVRDEARRRLARMLGHDPASIGARTPFVDLGVDSLLAVRFARELEEWLGQPLPATLLFDYPNLEFLAAELGRRGAEAKGPSALVATKPDLAAGSRLASGRRILAIRKKP